MSLMCSSKMLETFNIKLGSALRLSFVDCLARSEVHQIKVQDFKIVLSLHGCAYLVTPHVLKMHLKLLNFHLTRIRSDL